MKLLNQFFSKKKYNVDDDDLVWKRTDTDPGYGMGNPGAVIENEPARDMYMPKNFSSKINPTIFDAPKTQSTPKTPKRASRAMDNMQMNTLRGSIIKNDGTSPFMPDRNNNMNRRDDFGYDNQNQANQYFDFNTNNVPDYNSYGTTNDGYNSYTQSMPYNQYGQPDQNNQYNQYNQYNDYSQNNQNNQNDQFDYNSYGQAQPQNQGYQSYNDQYTSNNPTFNRNGLKIRSVANGSNQGYGQSAGVQMTSERNIRPELRDYYNIEENIMRKMMTRESVKQPTVNKNMNVFGGGKPVVNEQKAVNHFRDAVKRAPNTQTLGKQAPAEIKRRKNLVFKAVGADGDVLPEEKKPQQDTITPEFDSPYMGNSMEDLQRILREKNAKLAQLEEQNHQLVNNENNVTYIQKQINELMRETSKLKDKNSNLETEQRLLQEELLSNKDRINELDVAINRAPSMNQPDTQMKKDLIDKIAKNQQFINDINQKLSNYDEGKNKELEDIKKNSDKNMTMELEEIKINVMNYDEDLLKWMRYFEGKVSQNGISNVLDQSIF